MTPVTAAAEVRRVLICEDSPTYAAALSRLLGRDSELQVVGVCSTGEEAIARLVQDELKPHLVTMDLELPGMSGGDRRHRPTSRSTVSSRSCWSNLRLTM